MSQRHEDPSSGRIKRADGPVGSMVLSFTLFRRGFLGLFLIERDSICHIDPSSSES